jgi:hypothetical protein
MARRPIPDQQEGPPLSPFPQGLVPQGPGSDQPGVFGVTPPDAAPEPALAAGAEHPTLEPEWEYIRQFNTQNALLRRIYDALTGRERPPIAMIELQAGIPIVQPVRFSIIDIILVNTTAAGITATLTVGTRVYTFGVPATDTRVVPLPLSIENGVDVTFGGEAQGYLTGHLHAAEGG